MLDVKFVREHQEEVEQALRNRGQGISLDEFIYTQLNPLPQVVKIDIEGGEVLALPGMRRLLREDCPLVFLELHGPEAARVAWDELTAAGYHLSRMDNQAHISSFELLDWKAYVVAKAGPLV